MFPYGFKNDDTLYFEQGIGTGCTASPVQRILIDSAHAHGVKVLLGLGADQNNYATIASNSTMLAQYVNSVLSYAKKRGYDGVDVDWEFVQSNTRSAFINLITALRNGLQTWSPAGLLSVAVPGWYNPNDDIPTMNAMVDQVNLMTYDMTGYWSATTGFNAPLYAPQLSNYIGDNADGNVNGWLSNGLNPAKAGFGVPFYGLSWVGASGPVQSFSSESQVSYDWIMSKYSSANYHWQSNGQVPYLGISYDAATGKPLFISYEDSLSLTKKVQYAKGRGLGGIMIFELWRGLLNGKQPLMTVVKNAVGNALPQPLPIAAPVAPVLSSPFNGATGQNLSLTLSWSASTGASSYHVQVSGSSTFSSLLVDDSSLTGTTRAVNGLAYNSTYYWRVSAKNSAGNSSYSSSWSFTTKALPPPGVFALLSPANAATSQATSGTLSWQVSSNATQYDVYFGMSPSPLPLVSANQTATTYNYSGLANSGTYYWKVIAKNASGSTVASGSPRSFTTQSVVPTSSSDVWIYQDALGAQWYDWSWNSANVYSNTWPVYAGSMSLKITQSAWGGFYLHSGLYGTPVSINPAFYGQVQFAIYNMTPGLNLNVYLGNGAGGSFPTANVQYNIPVNQWVTVSVPISKLDPNNLQINRLCIQNYIGSTATYYIDNLRFTTVAVPLVNQLSEVSKAAIAPGQGPDSYTPSSFALRQNYPNPFNPTTLVRYELPSESRVSIRIYNLLGEMVGVLKDGVESPGYKSVTWDGSGYPSGVYFCRLEAASISDPSASFTKIEKMILAK